MLRIAPLVCLAALSLGGCADRDEPAADAARVERLLASIDEQQNTPQPVEAAVKVQEKVAKVDRVSGTLAKVQVDRIDPATVVALVSR